MSEEPNPLSTPAAVDAWLVKKNGTLRVLSNDQRSWLVSATILMGKVVIEVNREAPSLASALKSLVEGVKEVSDA